MSTGARTAEQRSPLLSPYSVPAHKPLLLHLLLPLQLLLLRLLHLLLLLHLQLQLQL